MLTWLMAYEPDPPNKAPVLARGRAVDAHHPKESKSRDYIWTAKFFKVRRSEKKFRRAALSVFVTLLHVSEQSQKLLRQYRQS